MMAKIIFNADDFGYSSGVNYGIFEAFANGVLSSTTLMVNMPGTEHAASLYKLADGLGLGLHLNISLGKPLTGGKSLTDAEGNFMKPASLSQGFKYDSDELYAEIAMQYHSFTELIGHKPTHLDSHLFSTDLIPEMRAAAIKLAEAEQIPLRNCQLPHAESVKFINYRDFKAKPDLNYILEHFNEIIENDFVEIMTHPGYVDCYLSGNSSYNIQRAVEVEFLTSATLRELINRYNVDIVTYKQAQFNQ